ncbi:MAG TPA: hypothetical protein VFE78_24600 [Gemmataceae bacterium]|nr:hypothetical protein [Gemmataceae bacterium]
MVARRSFALVLAGALASLGAAYPTQNFYVEAPTPEIAQQVGQYAEHYRREKARQWLGQEMPNWGQRCPLRVSVTMNGSGGATSFAFDRGQILSMDMHIEGTLDRLLASVLPHEVTHTVFAHYFRCPVPRWADEGGSVLSEDDLERARHDQMVRQILNTPGRAIPLRRLFALRDYPRDVMVLYAEGYSVTNFLVGSSSRPAFLAFLAQGMRGDWDGAVRTHYRYNSVEELEQAWLQHLRNARRPAPGQLASNRGRPEGEPGRHVVVRQTLPPAQPLLEAPRPIYRGSAPDGYDAPPAPARTGYNPTSPYPVSPAQPPPWPPAAQPPAPVRLLAPQFEAMPPPPPPPGSPVGYSR